MLCLFRTLSEALVSVSEPDRSLVGVSILHLDLSGGWSSSRIGDDPVCFKTRRMGIGVVDASLLLVAVVLLLLVLVGFQCFSRKKKLGLTVELARVATNAAQETWLSDFDEGCVNKLLLETAELDTELCAHLDTIEFGENQCFSRKKKLGLTVELARVATRAAQETWLSDFDEGCVNKLLLESAELDSELCAHLDTIEFGENLQCLRLSEGYCGSPPWKVIKYRCQLANESESFYRCRLVSSREDPPQLQPPRASVQDQWLYTVIQPQQQKPDMVGIHSNVVPRQAYLKQLRGMIATCREHKLCTRGFRVLREGEPYHLSCTDCALGEQLQLGGARVEGLAKLWQLAETDVKLVEDHPDIAEGSEGKVQKIYWRKGVFARKTFSSRGSNSEREIDIATEVSHPNIVHCFGVSEWSPDDQSFEFGLYMELLEESLESRIQEAIQQEFPFSFQDIVSVLWQVADAMRELHVKRFIHGDLKPGNILLSRLGMPHSKSGMFYLAKVADFGCAQRVPREGFADPKSADPEAVLFRSNGGTTNYTAPEVFRHRIDKIPPKHPEKIDVYSFGVVAYQMLTGVTKLYEDFEFKPKILKSGVIDGTLRPDTDFDTERLDRYRKPIFKSLVVKCWDPNPDSRPSFSDICDILETFSSEHGENGAHGYWKVFSPVMTFLKATIAKIKDKYE